MEGPSLFLAAEQLSSFVGEIIEESEGNTHTPKERLKGKRILSIFSYGKYLFFQFDAFAVRIHFLLWGSFEAEVDHVKVTGDYPKRNRQARLMLKLGNGYIAMFSCSIRFIEGENVKEQCDYTIDIMSTEWDFKKVLKKIRQVPEREIGDILLDQSIFLGVGNIIKNEVLLLAKTVPYKKVEELSVKKLKEIVEITRDYVFQFYQWRKIFELKKHYKIYRQKYCKICGNKVMRIRTGMRQRLSYICTHCEY